MLKCPGGEGEGRRDLVGRKKEGAFYVSMLSSFWPRSGCGYLAKGRTIRKEMGGGGGTANFQLVRIFFFSPSACAGFFFQVNPSE